MTNKPMLGKEFRLFENGRLFVAQTLAKDVVIVEGSVLGGPNMLPKNQDVIPSIAAALLDAGTTKKSKKVLRESLSERGISLSFHSSGDRTRFSGRCFPEDLPKLLATIAECLTGATFPDAEVKNAKALAQGELAEEKSDTRAQAERAFAALLYDPAHVNYARSIEDEVKSVTAVKRADLLSFKKRLGRGGLVVAIAGDVDPVTTHTAVTKAFAKLGPGTLAPSTKLKNTKTPTSDAKAISINDKANIDVLLGAALPLSLHDDLYHPMKVVTEMLGGGFTSHLMQTIRERDGLTYGVYATLAGVDVDVHGYLKIWATFSPAKYGDSVAKLRHEVKVFFSKGLTEAALRQVKERMIGAYLVSLSTTHDLAFALHTIGSTGRELSYLTEYPELIRAVTLADLERAVEAIPLEKLALVAAGTVPKS